MNVVNEHYSKIWLHSTTLVKLGHIIHKHGHFFHCLSAWRAYESCSWAPFNNLSKIKVFVIECRNFLTFSQTVKGGFFSESAIRFLNLQIYKIKIFQKTILSLKFKFPANYSILLLAGNLNFKFRIVFWNIFFWRFKKRIVLSEKKPPLQVLT